MSNALRLSVLLLLLVVALLLRNPVAAAGTVHVEEVPACDLQPMLSGIIASGGHVLGFAPAVSYYVEKSSFCAPASCLENRSTRTIEPCIQTSSQHVWSYRVAWTD